MKDEKEEIKPAPLKSWKDWCREAGTECGCGDVCMYAPKPAPLGEGKKDYTDADVAFANSYQRDNKHYIQRGSLGESSEEQKRVPKLVKWAKDGYPPIDLNGQYRHVVELIWHYIDMEKRSTSPTSEPPEEQEELWKEVSQWFGIETYSVSSIRELQKHFTIHRKRD